MDTFNDFPIIDRKDSDMLFPPGMARGMVPRDYTLYPQSMDQQPSEMDLIDQSEWDARYQEQEREESSLEHLFLPKSPGAQPAFVNLDQNGDGYCWSYSVGHCVMMDRLKSNQPIV